MDLFTFISSLVGSLAWPLLLLFIFCVLWYHFPRLAPFVHQLKYGGVEITFRQEATAVAAASVVLLSDHAEQPPAIQSTVPSRGEDAPLKADLPISATSHAPPNQEAAETKMRLNITEQDTRAYVLRARLEKEAVSGGAPISRMRLLAVADVSPRDAVLQAWQWVEKTLFQVMPEPPDGEQRGKESVLNVIAGLHMNIFTQPQVSILTSLYNMKTTVELDPRFQVSRVDALNYIMGAWNLRASLREHYIQREGRRLPFDE